MTGFLEHKRILVLGLGLSGRAAAALLCERGFDVAVADDDSGAVDSFLGQLREGAGAAPVEAVSAARAPQHAADCDCLVVSPGVPGDHPVVSSARAAGTPVVGEIEAAFHFTHARIVGVTGTNGKSTTVGVIGEILQRGGVDAVVAGNVGTPLASVVREGDRGTLVLELSSFQLDTIDQFRCDVAVVLNVTPDHLDRYGGSFEEYAASKGRILNRADRGTFYVYNHDDQVAVELAGRHPGKCAAFSSSGPVEEGIYLDGGVVYRRRGGKTEELFERSLFAPAGIHNIENAMAAVASAIPFGVDDAIIREALGAFRPLPHRMELVARIGGVSFIDDSKATNVDATVKSVLSVEGPSVLILGGRDKLGQFERLAPLAERVRAAVLIGEASGRIRDSLGGWTLLDAADMADAVRIAREAAQPGDTVLLAPACASFDMFTSYAHRGDVFQDCVRQIEGGER